MKALLFACCVVLLAAVSVNADLAPSTPSDSRVSADKKVKPVLNTGLEITTDPNGRQAKLQISQSDLNDIRSALAGTVGEGPGTGGFAFSANRTIIAGVLMFLAVSVAGILFARSGVFGRSQKIAAGLLVGAFVLGGAAVITHGNAGPPEWYHWRSLPQALSEGKSTYGSVNIEVVNDDQMKGRMKLIIPLKKQNTRGEE